MTDGSIYMSEQGELIKAFNVKDGLAIELLRVHGIRTGVISGKASAALNGRCHQLAFDVVETGCKNKLPKLKEICSKYSLELAEVAFCGDDVLDVPIMEKCGLSAIPSDAHELALDSASWISNCKGGHGFVRDFVDNLLISQLNKSLSDIYAPLLDKISQDDVKGIEQ